MTNFKVIIIREVVDVPQRYIVCLACTKSWVISIAAHIITMLNQACNLNTQERAGRSEVQDSPQLLIKFKVCWATWNPASAERNKEIVRNITLVSVSGALSQRAAPCMKLKSSCCSYYTLPKDLGSEAWNEKVEACDHEAMGQCHKPDLLNAYSGTAEHSKERIPYKRQYSKYFQNDLNQVNIFLSK